MTCISTQVNNYFNLLCFSNAKLKVPQEEGIPNFKQDVHYITGHYCLVVQFFWSLSLYNISLYIRQQRDDLYLSQWKRKGSG